MLETAPPLGLSPRLGRNFGNDYKSGVIPSDFCSRCFAKSDTVTGKDGISRNLNIGLRSVRLLSSKLPLTAYECCAA